MKTRKCLCILALIPLLASCGDKSLSVEETIKAINGEDAQGQKHDAIKVLGEFSKVTTWIEMETTKIGSPETKKDEDEQAVEVNKYKVREEIKDQLEDWCLYRYAYGLFENLGQGARQALNANNVDNYVNAMSLLSVFEEYTTSSEKYGNDDAVKSYPHADNMSYNYDTKTLSLNYTLTGSLTLKDYESKYIENKKPQVEKENLHLGFALNVVASYRPNGEVRSFSFVASGAHKAKPGDKKDHFEEYSYFVSGDAIITYEK